MDYRSDRYVNIQRIVILVLVVLLVFVTTTTVTLAIYSRFEQDSVDIRLAEPVRVYIPKDENEKGTIVLEDGTVAWPGSRISLTLRFGLEAPSSPAFIRAKLNAVIMDGEETTLLDGLLEFSEQDTNEDGYPDSKPNPLKWVLVNFNFIDDDDDGLPDDTGQDDIWYVFVDYNPLDNTYSASQITHLEGEQDFISGTVKISKDLNNEHAKKSINIVYTVGAIQQPNVKPPVSPDSMYYEIVDELGITQKVYIGTWGEAL